MRDPQGTLLIAVGAVVCCIGLWSLYQLVRILWDQLRRGDDD